MRTPISDIDAGLAKFRLFDDGLLWMTFSADAEIDTEETLRQHEIMKKLTEGKICGLLIDTRGRYISATREARDLSAELCSSGTRCADAILVDSAATSIVGNFYIRFNRPSIPTRMFRNEEKAITWLMQQVEKFKNNKS